MSISPRERTGGSYYPRAPNPTPSPQHGSERRRHGRRSPPATVSPPAAAAAPGAGGSGASSGELFLPAQLASLSRSPAPADGLPGEVGSRFCRLVWEPPAAGDPADPAIRKSINAPEKVVGFRISGEENDTCTQEVGNISECHSSEQGNLGFPVDSVGSVGAYPERTEMIESMDPDKMLQWEDIICVSFYSPSEVQCPICLESPLCPQITSCGHIYCFPCILRYLTMGKEDYKGECFKKCPLCFMMVSTKELYTIHITQVQNFRAGDIATFTLLSRSRNSLTPSIKSTSSECCSEDEDQCNVFSKFILTSDVELSVREAKSDLTNWLHMADLGLVDDLEKLPYVSAALEHLEERMKYWTEYRNYCCSPPLKDSFSPGSSYKSRNSFDVNTSHQNNGHKISPVSDRDMVSGISALSMSPESNKSSDKGALSKMNEKCTTTDSNEHDSYTFYQVSDGQHLILHPLNMRCLLNHFGGSDMLPPRITGKFLELETVTQSEAIRKRYRFLSHFSLTTTFQFCEIDLSDIVPPSSLAPFLDEIKKREKQRKRTAKKEESERVKAEVAAAVQASAMRFEFTNFSQSHNDVMFSLDDFEALGNNAGPSTSPPASERKLFSDVTRLGFASAQDSPPLRIETGDASGKNDSARDQGSSAAPALSFASIISSSRAATATDNNSEMQKVNGAGKKGKKPTRVLLSTGGGRRY
ncbi:RING finger protein 10 [Panicum miliaceum]|uniref:RING finger protein 10 n=1 Tax=Panicum miliaceum TaxID=4540 RepID=A0A3L6RPR3_PANMI|nr:RING finger protein 10 [Panicum miliaceum]